MTSICRYLLPLSTLCLLVPPLSGFAAAPLATQMALPGSPGFVGPLPVAAPTAAELRAEGLRRSAQEAEQAGRREEVLLLLRQIPREQQRPADAVRIGVLQVDLGTAVQEGIATLLAVDPSGLTPEERQARWQALDSGLRARGDIPNLLTVIDQSLPLAADEERATLCREEQGLLRAASDAELSALAGRFGATSLRLDLQTERGRRAFIAEDQATARQFLDEALQGMVFFCGHSDALQLRDVLEGGVWLRNAVGVILPLRDKFASFGAAVQRGIDMALAERPAKAKAIAFIVRDPGSGGEENARAVERLAHEERVMAIIGPLTGGAALAAGEEAERLKIPLLALAQKDGIPELGDFVFRDALTNRRQVEALVDYAVKQQGLKRFAILAPENRVGQEFAELFAQSVVRNGGKIVARQSYGESGNDFRTPVKLLKGENPAIPDPTDKESRKKVRTAPPPALAFDALFVPDIGERIGLLAPYLAFYGIENVQLLGTSAWNSPELLERSGRYVEGALFVDGFYAGSDLPRVRDFVARYSARYGEEPSSLEAEGYDLARLLISLLDRGEIRTRDDLRNALQKLKGYPGVTGEIAFDPQGETRKNPTLLRIENGALVTVNPDLSP